MATSIAWRMTPIPAPPDDPHPWTVPVRIQPDCAAVNGRAHRPADPGLSGRASGQLRPAHSPGGRTECTVVATCAGPAVWHGSRISACRCRNLAVAEPGTQPALRAGRTGSGELLPQFLLLHVIADCLVPASSTGQHELMRSSDTTPERISPAFAALWIARDCLTLRPPVTRRRGLQDDGVVGGLADGDDVIRSLPSLRGQAGRHRRPQNWYQRLSRCTQ